MKRILLIAFFLSLPNLSSPCLVRALKWSKNTSHVVFPPVFKLPMILARRSVRDKAFFGFVSKSNSEIGANFSIDWYYPKVPSIHHGVYMSFLEEY